MTKRVVDIAWWRRQKSRRIDPPKKDHVFASTDEVLADRLRNVRLPEPPAAMRERNRRGYDEWIGAQASRNRWRKQ